MSRSWILITILVLVIMLLVAWWLSQGGNTPIRELRSTSLGAILERPAELEDERIVVSGRVERLLTESAMTLGSDLVQGGILVLTPPGTFVDGTTGGAPAGGVVAPAGGAGTGVAPFLEGQFVQVTGTVRTFDVAAMTEEFALVLAPELFQPFEGEPVIITERFDIAVGAPQIPPPVEPGVVDVGALLAEPDQYAGQAVRVEGDLGEVVSERAFTLTDGEGEGALLVVGEDTGGFDEAGPGRRVRIEGTLLEFDEEALRAEAVDLGEGTDYSAFEGDPAIVPTRVEVVEGPEGEPRTVPPAPRGSPLPSPGS